MAKKIRPSSKYWRRREEAQRRKNIKDQKEYDKQIKSIYQKSMDNIQKEIDSFYARYAKKEGITLAEAKKRASKLDMEEYSRKAKRYVEEKNFSEEANEEMRLYNMTMKVNRLELLKANIGLELVDGFNDLQKFFEKKLTDRTLDEFERQAGILGDTITDTDAAKRAKVLVNASFHNAKWSDRIWMHQDLLKNKLDNLLRTGLIQGRNSRELARELVKAFNVSRHDAERLMRTEMCRVQTDAQKDSFERNGFEEYEYICCELPDACEICQALDGKIFKVKDMMPGENAPPMHPNDHCSTAAHYANREDFDAWLDAKAAGETGLGFEEWRNSTSAEYEGVPKAWEKKDISDYDAIRGANPRYSHLKTVSNQKQTDDYNTNCANCVVAAEMRFRGYDVIAKGKSQNRRLSNNPFSAWVNGSGEKTSGNGYYDILKYLNRQEDDVRIQITVRYPQSIFSAHSRPNHTFMAIKKNNKIEFQDPQIGVIIKSPLEDYFSGVIDNTTKYCRIDNLEVSDRGISACEKR